MAGEAKTGSVGQGGELATHVSDIERRLDSRVRGVVLKRRGLGSGPGFPSFARPGIHIPTKAGLSGLTLQPSLPYLSSDHHGVMILPTLQVLKSATFLYWIFLYRFIEK